MKDSKIKNTQECLIFIVLCHSKQSFNIHEFMPVLNWDVTDCLNINLNPLSFTPKYGWLIFSNDVISHGKELMALWSPKGAFVVRKYLRKCSRNAVIFKRILWQITFAMEMAIMCKLWLILMADKYQKFTRIWLPHS